MQLAAMVFPNLKEIQKEGEAGREKINLYTRFLALPLAVIQSISVLALLRSQQLVGVGDPLSFITMIATLVAGSMILMWLGELISQYGIGNGISMVLFAGIVGQIPTGLARLSATSSQQYLQLGVGAVFVLGVVALMVFMNEAVRKVQIQYARRMRGARTFGGQSTHYPVKVNVTGVLPIIFAVSLLFVPPVIGGLLISSGKPELIDVGRQLQVWFGQQTSSVYMVTYFLIVFCFTYFSALVFFNAEDIAEELKKSGAFVPGIRPGGPTKTFLEYVVTRVTFVGAVFLSGVALIPSLIQLATNIPSLAVGGTSLLIVVSVVLETTKQVESLMVGQHYEKYL
jgi:preprotein translocase subunit SecY